MHRLRLYGSISSVDFFVSPAVTFWGAAQLGGQILTIRPTASGFGIIFHFFGDGHAQVMAMIFQKGHVVQPANSQHSRGRNIHSRALSRSSLELNAESCPRPRRRKTDDSIDFFLQLDLLFLKWRTDSMASQTIPQISRRSETV